jgi:hypothetical protein
MKYTEGEQVLAKHPLLLGYHRGTVLDVKGDRYVIKFDTGGEHTVNEDDVQVMIIVIKIILLFIVTAIITIKDVNLFPKKTLIKDPSIFLILDQARLK